MRNVSVIPAKAGGNLGWRSFCIALDTRLRGYDVSLITEVMDKAENSSVGRQNWHSLSR